MDLRLLWRPSSSLGSRRWRTMAGPVVALLSTMAVACDAFIVPALQHGTLGGAGRRIGSQGQHKGTCVEESGRRRPAATGPATTKMMLGEADQSISAGCFSISPTTLLPGRSSNPFPGGRGREGGRGGGTSSSMDGAGEWSRTRMRTKRATAMSVASPSSSSSSSSSSSGTGGKLGRGGQRKEEKVEDEDEDEDEEGEHEVPPKYEGTIYAQSTAQGMGGIAVVRVSGVDALPSLAALSKPGAKAPKPRYAGVRSLVDPESGALLDKALVLYFEGPNTFTGEDLVEYHLHGGVAIVKSVLAALSKVRGLRMAGPGEFTRRAYLNGRMDLLEAEALNDLIHAETSGQQKQAMLQMEGAHRKLYQSWRTSILQCLAHVNAFIDYGEDAALTEEETLSPVRRDAEAIEKQILRHLADGKRGETLRSGLQCSLVGPPNAGKSSLLNLLAARPAAIVSSIPGTTRDIVSVRLEIGGVAVAVDDTAGLRGEGADEVEEEGMRRSAASFRKAQLRVIVLDGGSLTPDTVTGLVGLLRALAPQEKVEEDIMKGKKTVGNWGWQRKDGGLEAVTGGVVEEDEGFKDAPIIVVLNKCDLVDGGAEALDKIADGVEEVVSNALGAEDVHAQWISCETGEGTDDLLGVLDETVQELVAVTDDSPAITRARHRELLERCASALRRFRSSKFPVDVQAEELGLAMEAVGEIYGDADMEEMLDVVFRDFCIGK